jgi:hypothetical protein
LAAEQRVSAKTLADLVRFLNVPFQAPDRNKELHELLGIRYVPQRQPRRASVADKAGWADLLPARSGKI